MDNILKNFLHKKCVSENVATDKGISREASGRIVIPIFDTGHKFLFSKYRRDPRASVDSVIPKYTYDAGAKAALYNAHTLKYIDVEKLLHRQRQVFITEGEFKALCLETYGYTAVSSTGGASTFKEEWVTLLKERDIFIILDNDYAGIKGAFALQQKIPSAKIIFLPTGNWGKDINEYAYYIRSRVELNFMKIFDGLVEKAENYYFVCPDKFETKTDLNETIKVMEGMSRDIMERVQTIRAKSPTGENDCPWLEVYNEILTAKISNLIKIRKFFTRHKLEHKYGDTFERAKSVPISHLIHFSPSGYARSIWNPNDKNPSMKLYVEQNRVYDYSTGKGGDVVDVMMAIKNIKFKEAIDRLASGNY
jgi:DNA primase